MFGGLATRAPVREYRSTETPRWFLRSSSSAVSVFRRSRMARRGSVRAMDNDYVLGTHDAEIARLGLQHGVWRAAALEAWRRAGISAGQTVVDLGCGPGFATADLADAVGPTGRVIALDKSRRFLARVASGDRPQMEARACDLDAEELPVARADAVWSRWVFSFLRRPREVLARVARTLAPGGAFVAHEYFDYRTWRTAPRSAEIEEFVAAIMASWRAEGGEPDIALDLLPWLGELGFEVLSARPLVQFVAAGEPGWDWLAGFGEVGLGRLVDLGRVSQARAAAIAAAWHRAGSEPGIRMITPAVLEIVARLR